MKFTKLAIDNPTDLIFGKAKHPYTTRRGLVIGGGDVYPELNFTLPTMEINESTFPRIKKMYAEIITGACNRALELNSTGFVAELETLMEMTNKPSYAIELTKIMNDIMEDYYAKHGLKTCLRVTPNDTRDTQRPPEMRSGKYLDGMFKTFEGCAKAGGELLSIESTGGKEIHDDALITCDIKKVIFALSVMGCRDMDFVWGNIANIAKANGTNAAGDTACGFGNTAMVLAEQKLIPKTFAAIVRAATTMRSLVAYEKGAVGPGKDCGYENIYLKAITGFPMSMEGKTSACAHLSPLGNIASVACDLWSNESVQNIKLLGGMAPTVFFEQLTYDCRLMNTATKNGNANTLATLFSDSDYLHDPQAYILTAENSIKIAQSVVDAKDNYNATKNSAICALELVKDGFKNNGLNIPESEVMYLDMLESELSSLPNEENEFIEEMLPTLDKEKFRADGYDLEI